MNMNLSSNHQFQPFEDDRSPPQIISSAPHQKQMQEFSGPSPLKLKQKIRRNKPTAEMIELHKGRIVRSTCRKDRHSKVSTAKGPKDRRVRLSPNTAIQFYDVQDRLGYDRPSKAIDWLMREAKAAIDALDYHNSQKLVSENLFQSLDNVTVHTMKTCCHDSHENQISRLGWDEKQLFTHFQDCPDGGFSSTRSCGNEAPEVHRHCAHIGQQEGFVATSQTRDDAAPEIDRLQKIFNWAHTSSSFVDSVPLHFPYGDLTPVVGYSQTCNDDIRELLQSSNSCYHLSESSSRFPGISISNDEDILMMGYNADNGLLTKEDGRV